MSKITKTTLSVPEAFSYDYMHCAQYLRNVLYALWHPVCAQHLRNASFLIVCRDPAHSNVTDQVLPDVELWK